MLLMVCWCVSWAASVSLFPRAQCTPDSRVVSAMGYCVVLGMPWCWQRVEVAVDSVWTSSGHSMRASPSSHHQSTRCPLPAQGRGFWRAGLWRQRGTHRSLGGGGQPEPPVLLHGAPVGPRPAEGTEQLGPFARRGSRGTRSPSPL